MTNPDGGKTLPAGLRHRAAEADAELTEGQPLLAVVVISRNEERWIEGCLDSVLAAVAAFANSEVVVVDSCSTDETLARASRYPVRLVELQPNAPLSPALGRLVGERLTRSRYVLFVDGDTEIRTGWVLDAVGYLESHPRVAGVAGKLHEVYFSGGRVIGENPDCFGAGPQPEEVDQLGGNAIYRRAALEVGGSFNPYVVSYEEAELAERLRLAGYAVVRLPVVLGTHRTGRPGTVAELQRRRRDNLIKGYGQALRLGLLNGTFMVHARRMARYLQFIACCGAGSVALAASAATGDWRIAGAWVVAVALFLVAFMLKSRSVIKPLRLVLDWSFWAAPMVRGFLERPRDPRLLRLDAVVAVDRAVPADPMESARRAGARTVDWRPACRA